MLKQLSLHHIMIALFILFNSLMILCFDYYNFFTFVFK